jgi:hypothetical protein
MTPIEKAKEIVDNMYNSELDISYYAAKQCALIAVEEIINAIYNEDFDGHLIDEHDAASYWQEVKEEINKL